MFSFHQQSCSISGSIIFHYYYYWLQKHLSVVESVTKIRKFASSAAVVVKFT